MVDNKVNVKLLALNKAIFLQNTADGSWLCRDSYYYQGQLVYGTIDEAGISDLNRKFMGAITVNDSILK